MTLALEGLAHASQLKHRKRLACGLIPALNLLQSLGQDSKTVLASVGIRQAEFIDPAFTITLEQELSILTLLVDKLNQQDLDQPASIVLAKQYHLHNFSVLGLAISACAKLGDSFMLFHRFPRLAWGICEFEGQINKENITFQLKAGHSPLDRFLLERDMACVKVLFGEALANDVQFRRVNFEHQAIGTIEQYQQFFGCPVYFSQANTELVLSIEELDRPMPNNDALSFAFYEAQCARLASVMDSPFSYANLVRDRLSYHNPIPNLEELAAELELEARTLQRYLKKENESFSDILRDVRLKRAQERLQFSNLNHDLIAQELGFNDAVAFSHAFKRWTGKAPRQWLKMSKS